MEHSQLIEQAFAAYLLAIAPPPWNALLSNGAGLRIYPGESNLSKDGQLIVCYIPDSDGEEEPPNSGNRWHECMVELHTPIKNDDGSQFAAHQANATALQAAILSTTLPDQLSAAIGGFTVFGINGRTTIKNEEPEYWKSGWKVRLYSCPSAIPV